jgi:predicted XRE-type DNA-binding protein
MDVQAQLYPITLNNQHIAAAKMIAAGATQREVAQKVGISRPHLQRLMKSGLFRAKLNELMAVQGEKAQALRDRTLEIAGEALDVVEGIVTDPGQDVGLRLKAAMKVLELAALKPDQGAQAHQTSITINNQVAVLSPSEAARRIESMMDGWRSGAGKTA